jgi:hypothetical protein
MQNSIFAFACSLSGVKFNEFVHANGTPENATCIFCPLVEKKY